MLVEMLADDEASTYHNMPRSGSATSGRSRLRHCRRRRRGGAQARGAAYLGRPDRVLGADAVGARNANDLGCGARPARVEDQETVVRAFVARERADCSIGGRAADADLAHLVEESSWQLTFTRTTPSRGWSYHSLLMELLDLYKAFRDGVERPPTTSRCALRGLHRG